MFHANQMKIAKILDLQVERLLVIRYLFYEFGMIVER
jgi:hypothetical protein